MHFTRAPMIQLHVNVSTFENNLTYIHQKGACGRLIKYLSEKVAELCHTKRRAATCKNKYAIPSMAQTSANTQDYFEIVLIL